MTSEGVGVLSGKMPFEQRMAEIPANTLITLRSPSDGARVQLQVVTVEALLPLRQYGSPEWKPSGDQWPALLCLPVDKAWPKTDVLLAVLGKNEHYLFNVRKPLGPEGAAPYAPYAQNFAHQFHQQPGSVNMPYGSGQFALQDIGMWKVQAKAGQTHFPGVDQARFILAHGPDNTAILIEDDLAGSKYDLVWEGWHVDLNNVVVDVLTAGGK